MDINQLKNQATQRTLDLINSIRQSVSPTQTPTAPAPIPASQRMSLNVPQMSIAPKAPTVTTFPTIQPSKPLYTPIQQQFQQAKTIPSIAPNVIKPYTLPTIPNDRGFTFEIGKSLNDFKDATFGLIKDAIDYKVKQGQQTGVGFGTEFGGADSQINPMQQALELKTLTTGTKEQYAKQQLAKSEETLKQIPKGIQGTAQTAGLYFAPVTAFNKAFIQPTAQKWALDDRQKTTGEAPTPEELNLANKGELTRNQIYHINYSDLPREFYIGTESEINTKMKELGLSRQDVNKKIDDNLKATWNDASDLATSLIDPFVIASLVKGGVKGVAKYGPKAVAFGEQALKQAPEILASNAGYARLETLLPDILSGNIKNIESKTGKKLSQAQIDAVKNVSSKEEAKILYNQLKTASELETAKNLTQQANEKKILQSEIINLEPSTATLRTGRYGQNADVVAQVVKNNVTEIGKKMSPKINLKNIDELARKESTVISKQAQNIYKNMINGVRSNPKLSEELAILDQQHSAQAGEALRQAGGNVTPELLDALVRPEGFGRLIGQQLVAQKNNADGILTAVANKNIKGIENAIGRVLSQSELKALNGLKNLEDSAVFADELRFTAKKLNKYSENILQLENELRKLDDYEAQWLKAREYIAKNNIDVGNPEKFAEVYRMFFPANIGDWFNLIQYNSMLSAPTTFLNNLSYVTTLLKNTAGYTVQGALQQLKSKIYKGYKPEYDLGSGVRYAGGYLKGTWKALGQPTKEWFGDVLGQMKNTKNLTDTPNQIPALQGNMWDKSKGFFKRFGDANKKFGDKIASMGIPSPEEYNRIRLAKTGTALGYTEDFLKIPSNALEMADTIMGIILREGEFSALSKGVKFKNAKAGQRALRDLFKGDLTEEGAGWLNNVIGGMGEFAMKARNFKSGSNDAGAKSIRAFANFILPFVRVPTNWLKIGLEYTPAGALNLIGAKDKTVPLAKVITGLPISIFVASKYANGEMTGGMPQDKKTRDYWTENGIKPFSIKIGDTWYDYTKFNPFMSVTIMTTVGAMEAFRQKDITQTQAERLLATTLSVYEYWSQQSFVQNMGLLQNINSSDFSVEKLNKLGYNALSRAVPYQALLRWYSRLQDGSIKDPQTFKQTFEQNLPYFKQFAPNKVDSQGNNLKDEFNIYNSFPVFGRKSQQKAGAMEGLNELRNEQFINKSKTEIQKIIDEDVKKVAGGQISSLDKGQAPALIAGLNNIDPLNVYWLNPVGEKIETIGLDFTKYAPQNQTELKTYENKVNKIAQEVQYNPYISEQELTNILNRLNIPENRRINVSPEQKQQYFKLEKPEEKQPKVKATEEEKKKLLEFANLRAGVEAELPMLKLQKALSKAGQGKKPRLKKASLKKTKLAKAKIGTKLGKTTKLKPIKFAKTKFPTPKIPKKLA